MKKRVSIAIIIMLLTPALTMAFGDSIRYKGKLIRNGDTKAAVIQLLGPPEVTSTVKGKYYPGQTLKRYYVSGNLEEWIYTKINYTYTYIITFKGSKVIMIEKERK